MLYNNNNNISICKCWVEIAWVIKSIILLFKIITGIIIMSFSLILISGLIIAQPNSIRSQLQALVLDDVEITGKGLGRGAYGVVFEVRVSGLVCDGKTLHEDIVQVHILANDEVITTFHYLVG